MKLLLVDDNASITTMLSKYLTLKGHQCTVVNDGKEGLNRMKKENFDAVLMDLAMPEFSGRDLINSLVTDGTIKDHKIIVLSASSMSDSDINELTGKGVVTCLRKPVQLDKLTEALAKIG